MNQLDNSVRSSWWRFSDYEIWEPRPPRGTSQGLRDHYRYIRPIPGAALERYDQPVSGHSGSQPSDLQSELLGLDIENENKIIEFCRRFGLLGILTEELHSMTLAPRWEHLTSSPSDPVLFPSQTRYSRTHWGWTSNTRLRIKGDNEYVITLDHDYHREDWLHSLVSPEDTSTPPGSASIAQLFSEAVEEQTLDRALGQFFPAVEAAELETYEYPIPMSEEFWQQYAEPLGRFKSAIRDFREILENLTQAGPPEHLPDSVLRSVLRAKTQLQAILSVSPALLLMDDGGFAPRWAFSSLIAVAAFEVWQQLIGGQSVRHCRRSRCRRLFIPSNNAREYCSDRCKMAEEKARQRRKKTTPREAN